MPRLDQLTTLRGLAALYVVLFHCRNFIPGFKLPDAIGLLDKGYLAVDFFFVLSGFILAYVYAAGFDAGRGDYRRFLALRLARIWPVHVVLLVASVFVILPAFGFGSAVNMVNTPRTLLSSALLVHAWGGDPGLSWNFPSWSISAEWFAYLLFPALLWLSRPLAARPLAALIAAMGLVFALGVTTRAILRPGLVIGDWLLASHALPTMPFDLAFDYALLRVGFEFLAGLFLYRAFQGWRDQPCGWAVVAARLAALALLVIVTVPWPSRWIVQDTITVAGAALLILFVALNRTGLQSVLEWRPMVYLGEASYSIYMVHGLVLWAYYILSHRWLVLRELDRGIGAAVAAVCVAVTIAAGMAVYEGIEKPVRAAARARIERAR